MKKLLNIAHEHSFGMIYNIEKHPSLTMYVCISVGSYPKVYIPQEECKNRTYKYHHT